MKRFETVLLAVFSFMSPMWGPGTAHFPTRFCTLKARP